MPCRCCVAVITLSRTAHSNERRRRVRARVRLSRSGRASTTKLDRLAEANLDSHHGSTAPTMVKPGDKPHQPKRLPDCWWCPDCGWWNFRCQKGTNTPVTHCFRSKHCGAARHGGLLWKNATVSQKASGNGTKVTKVPGAAPGAAPPATRTPQQQRATPVKGGGPAARTGGTGTKAGVLAESDALIKARAGVTAHQKNKDFVIHTGRNLQRSGWGSI